MMLPVINVAERPLGESISAARMSGSNVKNAGNTRAIQSYRSNELISGRLVVVFNLREERKGIRRAVAFASRETSIMYLGRSLRRDDFGPPPHEGVGHHFPWVYVVVRRGRHECHGLRLGPFNVDWTYDAVQYSRTNVATAAVMWDLYEIEFTKREADGIGVVGGPHESVNAGISGQHQGPFFE
jgi:hypothetical protein